MNSSQRTLSGLSYISVVFAPIIFPIIILIASQTQEVKEHAKRALGLHLVPVAITLIGLAIVGWTGNVADYWSTVSTTASVIFFIVVLTDIGFYLYNLYAGVKVMVAQPARA
ncbi:DUF4870 domain-containing protein [Levilactobacillus bambusae]|uniref:DUF4870 domain-containing protein n=1 Tax=Levilactobacillus bambusae TaxID=2024736 RepID=A0A2V1MZI6_9LACO|nr:DUF4870 domain-containing protein [Levilactobacillus bambusae]PWF99509.1 hypothetical protein DCM90_08685 [Levilactobacillus bambusae]